MVGVPGRSKACHTCKQRRVKCTLEKPACTTCIKSNRLCGGYQMRHAFILSNYTARSNPGLSDSTLQREREAGAAPVLLARWRTDQEPKSSAIYIPNQHGIAPWARSPAPRLNATIPPRNSLRAQLLSSIIDDECPSTVISRSRPSEHRGWFIRLADIALAPAVEHAILAVGIARRGRQRESQILVRESLSLYTTGLRQLQRAIDDPASCFDEQNIAACMALIVYEFAECPGRAVDGYMNHYDGAMKLLQIRGPKAHSRGLAHSLFQTLRIHSAFQGLMHRRTTFLAEPEWIEKPWSSIPKSSQDLLLDIFLQIPSIFSKIDAFSGEAKRWKVLADVLEVVRDCYRLDSELTAWFAHYEEATAGSLYWPVLSEMDSEVDTAESGKLFTVSLRFPTFAIAETLVLYWTALVLIHSQLCLMTQELSHLATEKTNLDGRHNEGGDEGGSFDDQEIKTYLQRSKLSQLLRTLDRRDQWPQTSLRYICQSVEYFFQEERRGVGAGTIFSPLLVVRGCLPIAPGDWSREEAWIGEMLARIQGTGNSLAGCV